MEREALDAAIAREQLLTDLYGRYPECQLGFHNAELWETADKTENLEVSRFKQLQDALILCPAHPVAEIVKEPAAEVKAQQEQTH